MLDESCDPISQSKRVKDYESSSLTVLYGTKIFVSDLQTQYNHYFRNLKIYPRYVFVTVFTEKLLDGTQFVN